MRGVIACVHEAEVIDAVAAGCLPRVANHVAACETCRDTALVAIALADERDAAWSDAGLPASHVVWCRARLRARAEAARVAARPVLVMQAVAVACLAGAIAAVVGTGAWWLHSWAAWLASAAATLAAAEGTVELATLAVRGVLLALAVWLVIAPVAVYIAVAEEP